MRQFMLMQLLLLLLMLHRCNSCTFTPKTVNILDTAEANSIVETLSTNGTLDPKVTNSNPSNKVLLLLANNSLLLKQPLIEGGAMQIYCTGGAAALLILNRVDTDNNAPVWSQSAGYTVSVTETDAVPRVLTRDPRAADADTGSGQTLIYSIEPGPYSDYFSLSNNRSTFMNISLIRQLDYEVVQQVVLTLRVTDFNSSGDIVFIVNSTLTVTVVNVDDVNPIWQSCEKTDPCYERQLLSNQSAGVKVEPPVRAIDGDRDLNATIIYSIISQSPENILAINNITAELTLTKNLPLPQLYTIVLFATQADNSDKKTEAKLQVNVISTGYTSPNFDPAIVNVTVAENLQTGQPITVVRASAYLSRSVSYTIVNHRDKFRIDAAGQIILNGELDYESQSWYSVIVTASDGSSSGTGTVNVAVGNVNEFNPEFNTSTYSFKASRREKGLVVGRVSASDKDGDAVTFTIADPELRLLFAVDASLGDVSINADGAELPLKSYRITVIASDGSRTGSAAVSVDFDTSLAITSVASASAIAFAVLGSIFGVIIICAIAAFLVYKFRAGKELDESGQSQISANDAYSYTDFPMDGTSRQDNPIEGYNNFMFGDEDGPDIGAFSGERGQSELFVSDTIYHNGTVDHSTLTNGSIHTYSGSGSLVGSQRTLISGRPRQVHNGSDLRVVQVENAIDSVDGAAGRGEHSAGTIPGMTVYF